MRRWSISVIWIPIETCSESRKDCGPQGHVNSPTDPLGPTRPYSHYLQWDVSFPSPFVWPSKGNRAPEEITPSSVLRELLSLCCKLSPAVLGGWIVQVRCWLWCWGVGGRPLRSVACFSGLGNGDKYPGCHWNLTSCWVGETCILWTCKIWQQLVQALVPKSCCCWRVLEEKFGNWCFGNVESFY